MRAPGRGPDATVAAAVGSGEGAALGIYARHICPWIAKAINESAMLRPYRERVVGGAHGVVLEIGVGTGANFPFYAPGRPTRVYALEPEPAMLRLARRRIPQVPAPVELIELPAERNPLPDDSVDTVLTTFTLCTIPDPAAALAGMARVLRPGGELLFLEHGFAPDASVQRWQRRLRGIHARVCGGCQVSRRIPELIEGAGFRITRLSTGYIPGAPKYTAYRFEGAATLS